MKLLNNDELSALRRSNEKNLEGLTMIISASDAYAEIEDEYKKNKRFLRKLKQFVQEKPPLLIDKSILNDMVKITCPSPREACESNDSVLDEMAKIAWPYSREACEPLETKSLDRKRLDVENYSGYYRIGAKLFSKGLYGNVTYSRGSGLSDLRKVDGIKELLFQEQALDEMKADALEELFGMTHLDDIFTADEVSEVIKVGFFETMNISIEPVLKHELTQYMTKSFFPLGDGTRRTWMTGYETDKFTLTITWKKEPLD